MGGNRSQVLKRETLAERLLTQLRRQILSGALAPGQRIPSEQDISLAFGVGRTTVREALGGLVASGFATRRRHRLVVADHALLGAEDVNIATLAARISVRDVYETRKLFEVKAVELAAEHWNGDDLVALRDILAKADLVIALSEQWRERLLRICPAATVEVLPNAVALPDGRALRRLQEREPTLLFLGDLGRAKGTYDLVRAFARIAGRFARLKLVCAGVGAIAGVRQLAAQLDIADRVICPGWLDPERKRVALAGASIFALPSYAEGMPLALLEAMSWGLAVIATPVGGVPQLVTHEVNGLLVAPGDIDGVAAAIDRLLSDPALRDRLGAAARATIAAHFSLEAALERLGAIYRRFGIAARPQP